MVILPKEERVQRLSVCLDAPRSGLAFINSHIRDLFQGAVHQQAAAARVLYQYVTKRVCSVRYFIFSVINITFSVWPTSYSSNTSLKYQHVRLEHSCPYSYNIYSSQTRCQRFSPSWKPVRWRWTWCTDTLALSVWWSWSCLLHRLYLFDPQTTWSAAKQQCVRFPHACPIFLSVPGLLEAIYEHILFVLKRQWSHHVDFNKANKKMTNSVSCSRCNRNGTAPSTNQRYNPKHSVITHALLSLSP